MTSEDPKSAILARRARFVRAALLGAGLAACESDKPPVPPMVCLSVAIAPPPTATPDAAAPPVDAGAADSEVPSPTPSVCLRIRAPPKP